MPFKSKASQIEGARANETRIAAALEEARLEEEARAKEVADQKAYRERVEKEEQERVHKREREASEATQADARRRQKLADDYKARTAGGDAKLVAEYHDLRQVRNQVVHGQVERTAVTRELVERLGNLAKRVGSLKPSR